MMLSRVMDKPVSLLEKAEGCFQNYISMMLNIET